jgi:hypothetical protein
MLVSKNSIQKGGGISTYGLLNSSMSCHLMLISYKSAEIIYFIDDYFRDISNRWKILIINVSNICVNIDNKVGSNSVE